MSLRPLRSRLSAFAISTSLLGLAVAKAAAAFQPQAASTDATRKEDVIFLLHGIGNVPFSMKMLEIEGNRRGFTVVNWGYPSRKKPISEISNMLAEAVAPYTDRRISFITHSMGGLVVRQLLATNAPPNLGRFVMIGTPNQGAEMAEMFGDWRLFHSLYGPAGQDLRTGEKGTAANLGIPPCEFGVIAGGLGTRFGMNPLIPGDDDGLVTVDSTRLPDMKDFVLVPYAHGIIQAMPKTVRMAYNFIETGMFQPEQGASAPPSGSQEPTETETRK